VILAVAAVAGAAVLVLASGDEEEQAAPPPAPTAPATEPPAETTERERPAPPRDRLEVGLTERNAGLLYASGAATVDAGLEPWRKEVERLRPDWYRLAVDWSTLQPSPGAPADLAKGDDGCMRGAAPCGAFAGIRDQLRAVASQQRAHGGWRVLVVPYGVPEWAARPGGGCERANIGPRSRPITDEGLAGYRRLVRDLLALAKAEGVELRAWSPWNEPNQQFFISPQRPSCDASAPTRAPAVYARIVRALRAELRAAGRKPRLILGELAGVDGPTPRATGIGEFVRALPRDLACAADAWSQHAYAEKSAVDAGREGPVGQLRRALAARGCTRGKPIWVTETGIGGARVGADRDVSPGALRLACRTLARQLRRWWDAADVDVAFQYTFREDSVFRVGLADAGLTRLYPTYEVWRRWATRDAAGPPVSTSVCDA
jgi:hypothetical protein